MLTKFRRSSSRLSNNDCNNEAEYFEIDMQIGASNRDGKISMLAGQFEVYGARDQEVILTARTDAKPTK